MNVHPWYHIFKLFTDYMFYKQSGSLGCACSKLFINNTIYKWFWMLGITPSELFIDNRFISNTDPLDLHVQNSS